ncbi:MAG: cytochrome c [Rubellimicrobium sp.]|nr:cytochrome c [Rubellimicrobium sp.]
MFRPSPSVLAPAAAVLALTLATIAPAQSVAQSSDGTAGPPAALRARQAHMGLYQFNLMTLGAMAQGQIAYDAAAATAAASNLVALSGMQTAAYWQPGTAAGEVEGSRALPALWENIADAAARGQALHEAALGMAEVAGAGLEALQGAMGPLGQACSGCHQAYRAP